MHRGQEGNRRNHTTYIQSTEKHCGATVQGNYLPASRSVLGKPCHLRNRDAASFSEGEMRQHLGDTGWGHFRRCLGSCCPYVHHLQSNSLWSLLMKMQHFRRSNPQNWSTRTIIWIDLGMSASKMSHFLHWEHLSYNCSCIGCLT